MSKIFRLTVHTTVLGIACANVFHYLSGSNDGGQAAYLANKFDDEVTSALRGILNVSASVDKYSVVDVPDNGDFTDLGVGLAGTFGSSAAKLPAAYTYAFTFHTVGSPIRHGYKRFAGVDEAAITSGIPNAAFLAVVPALEAKMVLSLSNAPYTFDPIIVRYEGTPAVITLYTIPTACFFSRLGYQRTRES